VKAVLSIDFDYFIDVSSLERDIYFPYMSDEVPDGLLKSIWDERYRQWPQLSEIGVIDDFYILKDYLTALQIPGENFTDADDHKHIMQLLEKIPRNLQLMVVNIDFHHDYYHYYKGEDYCNCGNWLRRLVEERPGTMVKWIRRKDSQIMCLDGEFPFEHTEDIKSIYHDKFDYVFICRSPEWSPPHLINKYKELTSIFEAKINLAR